MSWKGLREPSSRVAGDRRTGGMLMDFQGRVAEDDALLAPADIGLRLQPGLPASRPPGARPEDGWLGDRQQPRCGAQRASWSAPGVLSTICFGLIPSRSRARYHTALRSEGAVPVSSSRASLAVASSRSFAEPRSRPGSSVERRSRSLGSDRRANDSRVLRAPSAGVDVSERSVGFAASWTAPGR